MNLKRYIPKLTILTIFTILSTTACEKVEPRGPDGAPKINNINLDDTFVYNENSLYKDRLKACVAYDKSCSLNTLPLLREEGEVTKERIKARLVVSHKWMGDRFLEMLDLLDDDIKELLGAVTAIVIDNDIHPAFYTTQTGAIYIDPRYLWLNESEAKDITQKDDFRAKYGSKLKFIPTWRYVKDGQNAIGYSDLSNPKPRTREDIKLSLARLLYHELSHANDFANRDVVASVDRDIPIVEALEINKEQRISYKLYNSMPLTQSTLKHLGKVLYFGEDATYDDKQLEASDVGSLFATDSATNMYNYANEYEDLAMLFETAMMKYHYNIEMDIGFVITPKAPQSCDDYILSWGVRNRIAKSDIANRASFVLKHMLPNRDWDEFIQNGIGTTSSLPTNVGWCASLDSNASSRKVPYSKPINIEEFLPPL